LCLCVRAPPFLEIRELTRDHTDALFLELQAHAE
jgi:hypothetical protein